MIIFPTNKLLDQKYSINNFFSIQYEETSLSLSTTHYSYDYSVTGNYQYSNPGIYSGSSNSVYSPSSNVGIGSTFSYTIDAVPYNINFSGRHDLSTRYVLGDEVDFCIQKKDYIAIYTTNELDYFDIFSKSRDIGFSAIADDDTNKKYNQCIESLAKFSKMNPNMVCEKKEIHMTNSAFQVCTSLESKNITNYLISTNIVSIVQAQNNKLSIANIIMDSFSLNGHEIARFVDQEVNSILGNVKEIKKKDVVEVQSKFPAFVFLIKKGEFERSLFPQDLNKALWRYSENQEEHRTIIEKEIQKGLPLHHVLYEPKDFYKKEKIIQNEVSTYNHSKIKIGLRPAHECVSEEYLKHISKFESRHIFTGQFKFKSHELLKNTPALKEVLELDSVYSISGNKQVKSFFKVFLKTGSYPTKSTEDRDYYLTVQAGKDYPELIKHADIIKPVADDPNGANVFKQIHNFVEQGVIKGTVKSPDAQFFYRSFTLDKICVTECIENSITVGGHEYQDHTHCINAIVDIIAGDFGI